MRQPPEELIQTIRDSKNFLLATHVYPDGDALGSMLALADILKSLGKSVFVYVEEKIPYTYDFMPGAASLTRSLPDLAKFDCAIALDCGDKFRLGKAMEQILAVKPTIMIDHHAGHKKFGEISWVDPERAATGEMVFDLASLLGVDLTFAAAYCLYAAIVSDTGSFKYSSTTAETMRVARDLIGRGVKPSEVASHLFDNFTVNRLQLLRMVLDTLELYVGGRLAVIEATQEMFENTSTNQSDSESFINYPRSLATVKVAAFVKETADGLVSVSLRSKGSDCDVAELATRFGGGGHRNAAGFKVADKGIDQVKEELIKALKLLVKK